MNVQDLEFIFSEQLDAGDHELVCMVQQDGVTNIIHHEPGDIAGLLPCLDCFVYIGKMDGIPRFGEPASYT